MPEAAQTVKSSLFPLSKPHTIKVDNAPYPSIAHKEMNG
jgi:hypothetical protein